MNAMPRKASKLTADAELVMQAERRFRGMATETRTLIERMYQRAMNLRDSTWQAVDFGPIEMEYARQYRSAYRTLNLAAFRQQTREYRTLLRAYRKLSLTEGRVSR